MALWRKAWVESRVRFWLAAAVMSAGSAVLVLFHESVRAYFASRGTPLDPYAAYLCRMLYQGFGRTLFTLFVLMFGLGGLLRERELGTAPLTLALPVARARVVGVRAAVGWIEVIALALLPSIAVVTLSPLAGQSFAISQALEFSLLWIAGGLALYAVAFLASAMLAGEYTAFIVAWVVMFGHTVTTQFSRLRYPALRPYLFTVQEMMSGFRMPYFDVRTHALIGPFPVLIVGGLLAFSAALTWAALAWTVRQDF